MKERKCPYKGRNCCNYGFCGDCDWHLLIAKYEKKISRLQRKIEKLITATRSPKIEEERSNRYD